MRKPFFRVDTANGSSQSDFLIYHHVADHHHHDIDAAAGENGPKTLALPSHLPARGGPRVLAWGR
jgi:hypothetical protein